MTEQEDSGAGSAPDTPGGLKPEKVEDRINVGSATPSDYPDAQAAASVSGDVSPEKLDDDKEYERLNPGSGSDSVPE